MIRDRERQLDRMIRRVENTIADVEQLIRDIRWWNQNRADCEPLDMGWELNTLDNLKKHLAHLRTRPQRIDGQYIDRILNARIRELE